MPTPGCYRGQTKNVKMSGTSDRVLFLIQMDFSIIVFFILIIFLRLREKLCFHENKNLHSSTFLWFSSKKKGENKIQSLTTKNYHNSA